MQRSLALLLALAVALGALPAAADTEDLQLYKLGFPNQALSDGRCVNTAGCGKNTTAVAPFYDPDAQGRFAALVTELGLALSAPGIFPARTTGPVGFEFGFGWTQVAVNADSRIGGKRYWVTEDDRPDPVLQMPTAMLRKGLPYGFEVGAHATYLLHTEMVGAGLDVRWALTEGFRDVPDITLGGHINRLIGSRDLDLFTGGGELMMAKRFPLAGTFSLTPYAGWDVIGILGNSAVIDFDPIFEDPKNPSLDDYVFNAVFVVKNRVRAGLRFGQAATLMAIEYSRGFSGPRSVDSLTVSAGLNL